MYVKNNWAAVAAKGVFSITPRDRSSRDIPPTLLFGIPSLPLYLKKSSLMILWYMYR